MPLATASWQRGSGLLPLRRFSQVFLAEFQEKGDLPLVLPSTGGGLRFGVGVMSISSLGR